ncbi:hypothetical protein [Snodgrassella alvi]|uniref:hypothetical protein n=1 Tax=Snodgrassella alvi TaxID=1196083 RepID=UPI002147D25B|nr:hypothetical protein [Snodgrassella alvi]
MDSSVPAKGIHHHRFNSLTGKLEASAGNGKEIQMTAVSNWSMWPFWRNDEMIDCE